MNINLDYKTDKTPAGEKQPTSPELTYDYISFAINQKYKDGLEGQLRRVWGRIQRKFDEAIEAKNDEIILEDAEKDLIKKAFESCKYPPQLAKFVFVLEQELDKSK